MRGVTLRIWAIPTGLAILILTVLVLVTTSTSAAPHGSISINGNNGLTPANGVVGGSGTVDDPFVIEGFEISGPGAYCLEINNTWRHLVIRNLTLSNASGAKNGIRIFNVANCTISNVTMHDVSQNIFIEDCSMVSISDVSASGGWMGIWDSSGVDVLRYSYHRTTETVAGVAIQSRDSDHVGILGCTLVGASSNGLDIWWSNHVELIDNEIRDLGRHGIYVYADAAGGGVRNYTIEGNTISNCTNRGLSLQHIDGVGIANNTVTANGEYGISASRCRVRYLRDNRIEEEGINLYGEFPEHLVTDFRNNTFAGREIVYIVNASGMDIPLDTHQIILVNCSDGEMSDTSTKAYHPWVSMYNSSNISIHNCKFNGRLKGISGVGIQGIAVGDCVFAGLELGLSLYYSSDVAIHRNQAACIRSGIITVGCMDVRISRNHFSNSFYGIGDSNIAAETGSRIVVDNNTFVSLSRGIDYQFLRSSSIVDNRFFDIRQVGIRLDGDPHSPNVTIARNDIVNASIGMSLAYTVDARVHHNTIRDSGDGFQVFRMINGLVYSNLVENGTGDGMRFRDTIRTLVTVNVIANCSGMAILMLTGGNWIHLNDFISNNQDPTSTYVGQAHTTDINDWDNGSRGNYWSDYEDRYPTATNDWYVWSPPYGIDSASTANFDRYPLVNRVDAISPIAEAGDNMTVDEGALANFDGTGSTDNRGITLYNWTFTYKGESLSLMGPIVGYPFHVPGRYEVTLNVSDAFGNWDADTVWLTVRDVLGPTADAGPEQSVDQFTYTTLDGLGSHDTGGIANYTWTVVMDDLEVTLYGPRPTLFCDLAGVFNVTLNVTDNAGHWAEDDTTLTVLDKEAPVPRIEMTYYIGQRETLVLDGSGCTDNTGIDDYNWTLQSNEGEVELHGMVVEHSYDDVGDYAGTLVLRDVNGNQALASFVVKVNDTEPPTIDDPGIQNALLGESFSFPRGIAVDNTGIAEFLWEFDHLGEEVRLRGEFQAYTFESSGEVVVSLFVWDSEGNEARSQFTLKVTDPVPPVADAGPDIEVDMGEEVTLVGAGSSDNEAIASYLWSFAYDDELRTLEGQCATHNFDIPGTYEVVLTVLDLSGNNGTDSLRITVRDTLPPEANFTVASPVDVGTKVLFDGGDSVDNVGIVEYSWEFEYRSSSMVLHGSVAEFEFAVPGKYEIRLTVTDPAGLEDSATAELVVLRPSDGDGDNGWYPTVLTGIAVVLAVVAAIGLAVLVRARRGKLE